MFLLGNNIFVINEFSIGKMFAQKVIIIRINLMEEYIEKKEMQNDEKNIRHSCHFMIDIIPFADNLKF